MQGEGVKQKPILENTLLISRFFSKEDFSLTVLDWAGTLATGPVALNINLKNNKQDMTANCTDTTNVNMKWSQHRSTKKDQTLHLFK